MIESLPSLKILTCTFTLGILLNLDQLQVLVLTYTYLPILESISVGVTWLNVRVMRIDQRQDNWPPFPKDALDFPRLENLYIKGGDNTMANWIATKWNTPSLRALSIYSSLPPIWNLFLARCGRNLEKLEVNASINPGQCLSMPNLRSFCVEDDSFLPNWIKAIQAPKLNHLGLIHVAWGMSDIEHIIEDALKLFPHIREMDLHGFEISKISDRGMLTTPFVERWTLRGIRLDFR